MMDQMSKQERMKEANKHLLNALLDENEKIMEIHNNVTVPINSREQGRSSR